MTFSGVLSCNLTDVNAGKRGGNLEDVSDSGCYDMAWAPVALGGCEECRQLACTFNTSTWEAEEGRSLSSKSAKTTRIKPNQSKNILNFPIY